jgi:hypothetical protein
MSLSQEGGMPPLFQLRIKASWLSQQERGHAPFLTLEIYPKRFIWA